MLVTANARKPTLSIDQPPPDVDDPLTGGSEFKEGDLETTGEQWWYAKQYPVRS